MLKTGAGSVSDEQGNNQAILGVLRLRFSLLFL